MNNIGISTSAFANAVTPFSPVGKQAVGLENTDTKQEVLPPVVESSEDAASADDKSTDAETAQRAREQRGEEPVDDREERQKQREEQEEIARLAARDREVRAHEQAHASVGGQYAGSASFTYERGPDGVNYAVGGEVPISLPSNSENPEQTVAAAEQVQRAALAPADPSPQDRRVAASAANLAQEARADIAEQRREEQRVEREQEAQKREEATAADEARSEAEDQRTQREQRLEELDAAARRSSQLSDRLVTLDNIQKDQYLGSVFDQRV